MKLLAMDADGGVARAVGENKAGAKFGTGGCDASCSREVKFTQGLVSS